MGCCENSSGPPRNGTRTLLGYFRLFILTFWNRVVSPFLPKPRLSQTFLLCSVSSLKPSTQKNQVIIFEHEKLTHIFKFRMNWAIWLWSHSLKLLAHRVNYLNLCTLGLTLPRGQKILCFFTVGKRKHLFIFSPEIFMLTSLNFYTYFLF